MQTNKPNIQSINYKSENEIQNIEKFNSESTNEKYSRLNGKEIIYQPTKKIYSKNVSRRIGSPQPRIIRRTRSITPDQTSISNNMTQFDDSITNNNFDSFNNNQEFILK